MLRIITTGLFLFGLLLSSTALGANSTANLRISPIGLLAGAVNFEADIVLNRYYTIAPMYTYWDFNAIDDFQAQVNAYGIRLDYHTKRVHRQGFLYGVFIKRWDIDAEYETDDGEVINNKVSVDTVGATAGYRWMWRSFNITAEVGYRLMIFNDFDFTLESGEDDKVQITNIKALGGTLADVTFGWAF